MQNKKVSIIGLGLIGGSIAKALVQRLGIRDITAVDTCTESINQAIEDSIITRGFSQINEYVWASDIIFICTPVRRIPELIDIISARAKPGCIITDTGSTKLEIVNHANSMSSRPCFIGGHPMAGTEKAGYSSSFSHLFENAYYILTPCSHTTKEAENTMVQLVEGMGGIPVLLDAKEHDRITAAISHVPHIIASALVNLVRELDDAGGGMMQLLAAGGFKDITRIASSSPDIWESIILSNKKEAESILSSYIDELEKIKQNIIMGDSSKIHHFFDTARRYRNTFPSGPKGLISSLNEIIVDVMDKPGIIGDIATILGRNNINIKNINVSNSREFEQGCLIITLPDTPSVHSAFELLISSGYKAYKRS